MLYTILLLVLLQTCVCIDARKLQEVDVDTFMNEMLSMVNNERGQRDLNPLYANYKLQAAAQAHSLDMAKNDYMAHEGSDGSTIADRIDAQGFVWSHIGENVAAGQPNVSAVMEAWMNSPGHRANILRKDFEYFGAGYAYNDDSLYKTFWSQEFGTPKKSSSDAASSKQDYDGNDFSGYDDYKVGNSPDDPNASTSIGSGVYGTLFRFLRAAYNVIN